MSKNDKQEIVLVSDVGSDEDIHLSDLGHILKKWRWTVISVTFIVVVGVTIISFQLSPVYQAMARILIEQVTPNVVKFDDILESDSKDEKYYQTQLEILQSRPIAEQVIQKLGLTEQLKQEIARQKNATWRRLFTEIKNFLGLQSSSLSEADQTAAEEEQILQYFTKMITIEPVPKSRLLDIRVRFTDRNLVASIVNTWVDIYIAQDLEYKTAASKEAVQWLTKELEDAQQKVLDSETQLQAYKEQYELISVEDRQNIVMQKLSELSTAVNQSRVKRMTVEVQYKQMQTLPKKDLDTLPQVINDPLIRELKVQLLNLNRELSEMLKKFRSQHPDVLALQSQIDLVEQQLEAEIQKIFNSIKNEYQQALAEEQTLLNALEDQKREVQDLNQKTIKYNVLLRDVESNRRIYESLLQRMKETSVTERLETSNIRVIERATVPNFPVSPRKILNILLALLGGAVLGVIAALLGESRYNKINTPEEFKHAFDLHLLGVIPKVTGRDIHLHHQKKLAQDNIIATLMLYDPQSPIAESFRGLRTNVMFSLLERGTILLVTSSEPSEGKSSIVTNLGIAMAQNGSKTLIIDCDFRRPTIGQFFNLNGNRQGFTDMIASAGTSAPQTALYHTDLPTLDVIPCGTIPPNPTELLGSTATRKMIESLAQQYDIVLIDSPPIHAVADPIVLSCMVSGVLLVIRAGQTKREVVHYASDQLREVQARVIGGILNCVDLRKNKYYYGYQYTQYYRQKKSKPAKIILTG